MSPSVPNCHCCGSGGETEGQAGKLRHRAGWVHALCPQMSPSATAAGQEGKLRHRAGWAHAPCPQVSPSTTAAGQEGKLRHGMGLIPSSAGDAAAGGTRAGMKGSAASARHGGHRAPPPLGPQWLRQRRLQGRSGVWGEAAATSPPAWGGGQSRPARCPLPAARVLGDRPHAVPEPG